MSQWSKSSFSMHPVKFKQHILKHKLDEHRYAILDYNYWPQNNVRNRRLAYSSTVEIVNDALQRTLRFPAHLTPIAFKCHTCQQDKNVALDLKKLNWRGVKGALKPPQFIFINSKTFVWKANTIKTSSIYLRNLLFVFLIIRNSSKSFIVYFHNKLWLPVNRANVLNHHNIIHLQQQMVLAHLGHRAYNESCTIY